MEDLRLRTARLTLRPITLDDVDRCVALNADPGVMRYLDRRPPSREAVAAEIEALIAEHHRRPGHGRLVAEDHTGRFVGWFGLRPDGDDLASPSLGYRLRRDAWGGGLATEGGTALVDLAFTDLAADRVTAQTMSVNRASRRVMEKCGLRYVRTFHEEFDDPLPGTEHGEVWYEITRAQWRARPGTARRTEAPACG